MMQNCIIFMSCFVETKASHQIISHIIIIVQRQHSLIKLLLFGGPENLNIDVENYQNFFIYLELDDERLYFLVILYVNKQITSDTFTYYYTNMTNKWLYVIPII